MKSLLILSAMFVSALSAPVGDTNTAPAVCKGKFCLNNAKSEGNGVKLSFLEVWPGTTAVISGSTDIVKAESRVSASASIPGSVASSSAGSFSSGWDDSRTAESFASTGRAFSSGSASSAGSTGIAISFNDLGAATCAIAAQLPFKFYKNNGIEAKKYLPLNREFQIKVNTSWFQPLSSGVESVVKFLNTLPLEDGLVLELDTASISRKHEDYVVYDTPGEFFKSKGHVVQTRNTSKGSETEFTVTMKRNNFDFDVLRSDTLHAGKKNKKDVEEKLEMDIYPCQFKFAKSIKTKTEPLELKSVKVLRKFYSGGILEEDGNQALEPTRKFARSTLSIEAQLKQLQKPDAVLGLRFVISASYASMEEAKRGVSEPFDVEVSFRLSNPYVSTSALKSTTFSKIDNIRNSWSLYGSLQKYCGTIMNDC
ncbi:hypothetical protein MP638_006407 [Amoeboaphelidium occidentale]|nr:hypothetical protein MP638_006407 [Amoeboaphelidium occidentale]